MIWQKKFWVATAERTIFTAAEVGLGFLGADGLGILDVDWTQAGSVTLVASLACILKCVVSAGIDKTGPSFGSVEKLTK